MNNHSTVDDNKRKSVNAARWHQCFLLSLFLFLFYVAHKHQQTLSGNKNKYDKHCFFLLLKVNLTYYANVKQWYKCKNRIQSLRERDLKLNGYSAVLRNWAAQICYSSSQINGTKSSNMDLSVSVRAGTIVDDAVVSWFCKSLSAMEWGQIKLNLFVVFGTWCRQSIPVLYSYGDISTLINSQ